MGIKRIVDVSFWTDRKVDEFSPEDKYFMLYLLTSPFSTQLGIYEISIKQIAFQLGYSVDSVKVLLDRFENKYKMILFSEETSEIAIKNFLKHSIIKGGAPVRDCLIRELKNVKDKRLISAVFAHIKDSENLNLTVKNIISEFESKNGELKYSNENNNENNNDNDNENDVSYNDTFHDTCTDTPKKKKPTRHKYGEYKNVLLSDDDFEKLKAEFPVDYPERIERLSSYMASTGKSYKNHLVTIRNWARKDGYNKPQQTGSIPTADQYNADALFD